MTKVHPGDLIDITIRRVKVVGVNALTGAPTIVDEHGAEFPMPPQAAVERVAPAQWPPEPGDLWREERTRALWFVFSDPIGDRAPSGIRAREADGARWTDDALNLLDNGPLTLVFRDLERPPF